MRVSVQEVLVPWTVATMLALTGCRAVAPHTEDFVRPTIRSVPGLAGVTDRQIEFGKEFCRNYARIAEPGIASCERWLVGTPKVASETATVSRRHVNALSTVVVIPGIFGECLSRWVTPYSTDYEYLEQIGYRVLVINVTGRGSSALNAGIIHDFFATHAIDHAVVIAYSKGATDFMFAAAQPEARSWAARVAAFVSIAGVVSGTPLASRGEHLYNNLLAQMPFSLCQRSDGGGVSSLTYQAALQTASAFARVQKPYSSYSVSGIADHDALNPVLRGSYDLLTNLDWRNDGQVLLEDTIVPGSSFLGAFRADHWSIALPFEESKALPMRPFSINNQFPRRALITSVLDFVNRSLHQNNADEHH